MLRFLFRRAVLALLVCLTVLVVSFALTRLSGDLAISIAGPNATAQDIETIRTNYGLDRPLPVQFIDWAVHAAEGDLGRSYLYHAPVAGLIKDRLPITLTLGLTGLVIALSVSIPLGICAAVPQLFGIVGTVWIGRHSDRHRERRWHYAACVTAAATGMGVIAFSQGEFVP